MGASLTTKMADDQSVVSAQNAATEDPASQADNPHSEHGLTDNIQKIIASEKEGSEAPPSAKRPKVDLQSLPTRAYLDQTRPHSVTGYVSALQRKTSKSN